MERFFVIGAKTRAGVSLAQALGIRLGLAFLLAVGPVMASGISGSKHDLSSTATPDSNQVCIYCHTPHSANNTLGSGNVPLWNRYIRTVNVYTVYTSPSMVNTPTNPAKTVSAACLGCHDGTVGHAIVYGVMDTDKMGLINGPGLHQTNVKSNCNRCHTTAPHGYALVNAEVNLGMDLSNMHPIAVAYPTGALGIRFRQPPDPAKGWPDVKLFSGRVECPSCHTPHDPSIPPFLRTSNAGSALCLKCHIN